MAFVSIASSGLWLYSQYPIFESISVFYCLEIWASQGSKAQFRIIPGIFDIIFHSFCSIFRFDAEKNLGVVYQFSTKEPWFRFAGLVSSLVGRSKHAIFSLPIFGADCLVWVNFLPFSRENTELPTIMYFLKSPLHSRISKSIGT